MLAFAYCLRPSHGQTREAAACVRTATRTEIAEEEVIHPSGSHPSVAQTGSHPTQ
jgi:hypothetical protein